MATKFPEILSSLRKEKKLSQKQAALDLGISQALLSHYEKGIRECGLDFLCRASDYYNVSADFLLGLESPEDKASRSGTASGRGQGMPHCQKNRKIGLDSLSIVFCLLEKINSEPLAEEVCGYIFSAIHEMYQLLSRSGSISQDAFRHSSQETYLRLSICEQRCRDILSGNAPENLPPLNRSRLPSLTADMLRAEFEDMAESMLKLSEIVHRPVNCIWQGYEYKY